MNTPNPLIPGGAFSEVHYKSRSNVRLAVFTILAVHVVLLVGLLMQGCGPKKAEQTSTTPTNDTILPPLATNELYFPQSNPPPAMSSAPAILPPTNAFAESTPSAPEPVGGMTEYTVARNDTLSKIAKEHGISVKALTQANPTVDPAKLKVGQKLLLPAASRTSSAAREGAGRPGAPPRTTRAGESPAPNGGSSATYVVKSGDTLVKIDKANGAKFVEVPLSVLLKDGAWQPDPRSRHGRYVWQDTIIWGATARILTSFLGILGSPHRVHEVPL